VAGGTDPDSPTSRELGRYTLHGKIAGGGMATVHLGRQRGAAGFSRVVAIKRMLPRFAKDPRFVAMFVNEAMLASRIQHPNVVTTLDVVAEGSEILIVMEYIRGDSLSALAHAAAALGESIPVPIAAAVMLGALAGLHAAHEARDGKGEPVRIVHRDVSPHNILLGVDGVARVMDFGIAKATQRLGETQDGALKGKLSYTAPECFLRGSVVADARSDVFSAGAVFWGLLAGRKLFDGVSVSDTMAQVLAREPQELTELRDDLPPGLDEVIRRALARDPDDRFPTAREFEDAVHEVVGKVASQRAVGEWVQRLAATAVATREAEVQAIEQTVVLDPARASDLDRLSGSTPVQTDADAPLEATRPLGRAALAGPPDVTVVVPLSPPSRIMPIVIVIAVVVAAVALAIGLWVRKSESEKPALEAASASSRAISSPPSASSSAPSSAAAEPSAEPVAEPRATEAGERKGPPARPKKANSRDYFPPRP
jgi:serine/threonine protein kinase